MSSEHYNIPDWIYETAPYGYFIAGIWVLFGIDGHWAIFSGLTLLSTGALILAMRRNHRKFNKEKDSKARTLDISTAENSPMQLVWEKKFESGNEMIDQQHKNLFESGNALLNAVYTNKSETDLAFEMNRLIENAEIHFTFEDSLLESWDYIETDKHKRIHQSLLNNAYSLRDEIEAGELTYGAALNFFLKDLVVNHILKEDKKYFFQL